MSEPLGEFPVITEAAHEVHLQPERDKMWVSEMHGPGQAGCLALHTLLRHMQKKVYLKGKGVKMP